MNEEKGKAIRCMFWACRKFCQTAEDAIRSSWGRFESKWDSGIGWHCPDHLTGNEEVGSCD